MNMERNVPEVVIRRLPRYYRYLGELLKDGINRISSGALSKKMNVTASQIRQDFNYFGGFGQQGYGYNVEYLYNEMGEILGLHDGDTTIIIGAGNLGRALANHNTFEKRGFRLVGIFDNNAEKIGSVINNIKILDISCLKQFISENRVDIAILTVPKSEVHDISEVLADSGVMGILNFSYTDIKLSHDTIIENVHMSDHLMMLSYKIATKRKELWDYMH